MTLATVAAALAAAFVTSERTDGTAFYYLADGSPEWMQRAVRESHGGTMPDDVKYGFIRGVALAIDERLSFDADTDLDDVRHELIDGLIPIYNTDRTAWLASNLNRGQYVDDVLEEGITSKSIFELLAFGIDRELNEVWDALVQAMTEQVEEEEDDDEGVPA